MVHTKGAIRPKNAVSIVYKRFFIGLFVFLVITILFVVLLHFLPTGERSRRHDKVHRPIDLKTLKSLPVVTVHSDMLASTFRNPHCSFYDCFNIYRCGERGKPKLTVYVYPLKKYVDDKGISISWMSQEYKTILQTIVNSEYYTPNPEEACILVPSIDMLNQNRFRITETSQALASLEYWNNGENHLIFNMVPGVAPDYSTVVELPLGSAMVAGAGFSSFEYRASFDISLPVFSSVASQGEKTHLQKHHHKIWMVMSSQVNIHKEYIAELSNMAKDHPGLIVLGKCKGDNSENYKTRCIGEKVFRYPEVLQRATFCLVIRGARLGQPVLMDALASGCIPVVIANTLIMPFEEVIDWNRAAIFMSEGSLGNLMETLTSISDERIEELQNHTRWLYHTYFSTIKAVTLTTLDILNDRVFSLYSRNYEDWNIPREKGSVRSPLYLPITSPRSQGFTAIILTYDRVQSLFTLIEKLVKVPSLSKILVIWNNQQKAPPPPLVWPKISKPLKVIRTNENKLSNRFYPYDDIETEAILTIDDDIVMLTADELEFGYEVWREFPDRIVGFPSRTHVWDNRTNSWKYESEWTNEISMVLTGAAFHHKFWNYLYTTSMPGNIKEWVDEHMNCEDIAMNFLVANMTRKAPIKVTPRKKFKCPECINNEMLSADLNHMMERSACINRFTKIYGRMPLETVEFRADPVLYKDVFPEKLKRFNDVGSL